MKILFVASEDHLTGTGGGVTHARSMLSLFRAIEGTETDTLSLPAPSASLSRSLRKMRALAASAVSDLPSKAHFLLGRGAQQRLRERLAAKRFDVVVFNGADLLSLAGTLVGTMKGILISHNIETEIIRGQIERLRTAGLVRQILRRDIEKTQKMEIDGAARMSLIIAISHDDAAWYRRRVPQTAVETISGAFPDEPYGAPRPVAEIPLRIGYLAKMSWWPNREGAEWFLRSVAPELDQGRIESHFFGPGSDRYDGRIATLHVHGFVERLDTVWSTVNFTICPIHSGSGVNIKLIESLFNGVPVLATPKASRGLPPIDDPALAIVPPGEWPAFLNSERAFALASATVRKETVKMFSARYQAMRLRAALQALTG